MKVKVMNGDNAEKKLDKMYQLVNSLMRSGSLPITISADRRSVEIILEEGEMLILQDNQEWTLVI